MGGLLRFWGGTAYHSLGAWRTCCRQTTAARDAVCMSEPLSEYLAPEAWQTGEIQQAVAEADAGDFASTGEISTTLNKWGVNAD